MRVQRTCKLRVTVELSSEFTISAIVCRCVSVHFFSNCLCKQSLILISLDYFTWILLPAVVVVTDVDDDVVGFWNDAFEGIYCTCFDSRFL